MKDNQNVMNSIQQWFESVVLGLNLCPFAAKPYKDGLVRFEIEDSAVSDTLLKTLIYWLDFLGSVPETECETLVLIVPNQLENFLDYNQFLDIVDALLVEKEWEGVYQVASFHPDYQFADVLSSDVTNYTNRAPYPILHILRESSVEKAVQSGAHIEKIIERNQKTLRDMPAAQFKALFHS